MNPKLGHHQQEVNRLVSSASDRQVADGKF